MMNIIKNIDILYLLLEARRRMKILCFYTLSHIMTMPNLRLQALIIFCLNQRKPPLKITKNDCEMTS